MTGPIALHGGGEFQSGDEPFLRRLLDLAGAASNRGAGGSLTVAIVPTAAARGRPDLVGAHGTAAFERLAGRASAGAEALTIDVVPVLDAASSSDAGLAARLEAADVIHLPGGDPDLIPSILAGTAAWDAIVAAHRRGAVLAGASAGAMALAGWTWTPAGGLAGLGLVEGLVVVPHADEPRWVEAVRRFGGGAPAGLGLLGIAERTGVISPAGSDTQSDGPVTWEVVGEGSARWLTDPGDLERTVVVPAGSTLEIV